MPQNLTLKTEPKVIHAAKMAARKEGIDLQEWLSNTILQSAREIIKNRKRVIVVKEEAQKYKHFMKK